jgi:hypothetical protein
MHRVISFLPNIPAAAHLVFGVLVGETSHTRHQISTIDHGTAKIIEFSSCYFFRGTRNALVQLRDEKEIQGRM